MKTILLLTFAAGIALADPCATCTEMKICEAHAQSDKEAMKALREWLAQADPAQRLKGVENFAIACVAHDNCRPTVNAQALAAGLKDGDSRVRARSAELLGETQDPKTAGTLLTKEVAPLVKKLAKEPRGTKEEEAWIADFETLSGILRGLGSAGSPEAGVGIAAALQSTRIRVIAVALKGAEKVRAKVVIDAMLAAFDRILNTPQEKERNAVYMQFLDVWEKLTSKDIKRPDTKEGPDGERYAGEIRQWWKANQAKWK